MNYNEIIDWLLTSDVSVRYQVYRDLIGSDKPQLKECIANEGWGGKFLGFRSENGHWGKGFYQPKWTSTHYTLLNLRNLEINPDHPMIRESVLQVVTNQKGNDGGINPAKTIPNSDVCINGMVLNYASYFNTKEEYLISIVDFILSQRMHDGGFNCWSNQKGAFHSSLHTTLSVAEGISEYRKHGYKYRIEELSEAEYSSREFMLQHRLCRSDKTGNIIDKKMLMLSYPAYWRYDILRALDYLRTANASYDRRMEDALWFLIRKRRKDGRWSLQARHPGQVHFHMEIPGEASRWNTLRALRVLKHFKIEL